MENYINLIKKTITRGNIRTDRTNTGTISLFGPQLEFDLSKGFPLDTSRQIFLRGDLEELFWMLRGSTDNTELTDKNVNIWNQWSLRQEDLEYSQQERLALLRTKCIESTGSEKEGHETYLFCVNKTLDVDRMLEDHDIPRLKPNPANAKIGALGPVYGEQWAAWPDPKNDVKKELTFLERIVVAEDYLASGLAEGFTQDNIESLKKEASSYSDEIYLGHAHGDLDEWGIPREITKRATINQIAKLIEDLKTRPNSRRHIVSAWNVAYLPDESISPQANVLQGKMALAPCHTLYQFYVEDRSVQDMIPELPEDVQRTFKWFKKEHHLHHLGQSIPAIENGIGPAYWEAMFNFEDRKKMLGFFEQHGVKTKKLSCKLYQRSADICIGVPFNIAAYAAQTMMVAQCVDMVPGNYIHTFGDAHIYKNHLLPNEKGESVFTQLAREERPLPKLIINPEVKDIFSFTWEDFKLEGYDPHPAIKYKVAV